MACKHDFIRINDVMKPRAGVSSMNGIHGAEVGCVLCGEVRRVYADGEVSLIKKGV